MIKVFEAFAGYGSQRMALRNLGIEHEVVGISEIDKFAIKSYMAVHGETKNYGDISKIDPNELPEIDLFTYSFPCQDISVAGNQKGLDMESGTRSSLLWECLKIIQEKKPKYLLMENVKNLVGKKHINNFYMFLGYLEMFGYKNYWKVLNAKDYGIPQNRERVFVVSILGGGDYEFPQKQSLKTRLKNLLEVKVEEKYYLKSDKANQLLFDIASKFKLKDMQTGCDMSIKNAKTREIANCLMARYDSGVTNKQAEGTAIIERIGGIFDTKNSRRQAGAIYSKEGISPTLDTMQGGWRQPSVLVKQNTKKGYIKLDVPGIFDGDRPNSKTRRGRVIDNGQTVNTLTCAGVQGLRYLGEDFRIRKLTPKECWRLMGCIDKDFEKAEKVNSNSQLYKQAGNSIVVNVLEEIFRNLLLNKVEKRFLYDVTETGEKQGRLF